MYLNEIKLDLSVWSIPSLGGCSHMVYSGVALVQPKKATCNSGENYAANTKLFYVYVI